MKKYSKKIAVGISAIVLLLIVAVAAGVFLLRIDEPKARNIALSQSGGGQIISQEIEQEGFLNEYKYEIVNGSSYYEMEINGFGTVKELEVNNGS